MPRFTALPPIAGRGPQGGGIAACHACGVVQKPCDPLFLDEIGKIYSGYEIYQLSSGLEQPVFSAGLGEARSMTLLKRAFETLQPAARGRMLDVGCGNGGLLKSFAARLPEWCLAGSEMSDTHKKAIESIPGVEALYVGDIDDIPGTFNLITMLHSLEHITEPVAFLAKLKARLAQGGRLLIEVPDLHQNPFDLLIADHVTHFSRTILHRTLSAAGYAVERLSNNWIAKELSAIATPGEAVSGIYDDGNDRAAAVEGIARLTRMIAEARDIAAQQTFGIFGTSIAGTWLAAQLLQTGAKVDFFVDEDQTRVGRQHMGLPVLGAANIAPGAKVYVPLAPAVARAVTGRLGVGQFVAPSVFN